MSNINVLVVLIWGALFGVAGSIDEWKYAKWPFLGGILIFATWVLIALDKVEGL